MPTPRPAKPLAATELAMEAGASGQAVPSGVSLKLSPADPKHEGTLAPGTLVAERYRIDALLGEGGMGKVYAAEHVHMHKQVAIKVLHAEMSSTQEIVARFEREAVAAGKISHPNVAAATDFGRLSDTSFFLVLEYVAGKDLRHAMRDGPLSPGRAAHIVRQIAAAVGAAHAAGVVHRDLKPENIMLVDRDGDADFVKVLDFGIAKLDAIGIADPAPGRGAEPATPQPLTKMGAVFGTPDYMSPEQALGQAVDARSDLYSIGVMFYELLSGQRPFRGGAVTLMRAHVLDAVPALPPDVLAEVGPEFDAVIQRLLQKSSSDRYANAAELVEDIDALPWELSPALGRVLTPAPAGPTGSAAIALGTVDTVSAILPAKAKRPRRPLLWLAFLGLTGAMIYGVASSPVPVADQAKEAIGEVVKAAPLSSEPATATPLPPAPPALDTAEAPQALDPASPADPDDTRAAADDPAPSAAASGAAPRAGVRFVQPKPAAKVIHKTKPAPPPRRPLIPPPSQWFKN